MSPSNLCFVFVFVLLQVALISGKKFERCDLARQLLGKYKFPPEQIGTWICIVQHESNYDTNAYNPTTKDHGLFQISELFWCNRGTAGCGVPCTAFHNDDISDDVICVKKIFDETTRLKGNGFLAWTTYDSCKSGTEKYIQGCGI